MDWKAEIRETLRGMVADMQLNAAVQATVVSVDKAAGTIVAHGVKEGVDYHDVRLKAVVQDEDGRGILAYPKEGSRVCIVWLDGVDVMGFVAQYSAIDSFLLTVDNGISLELTAAGELLLNGASFGGVVKVQELTAKLNLLEAAVNKLDLAMGTHGHPLLTPVGAPFPALVAGPSLLPPSPLTPTQVVELANPNVKHG